MTVDKTIFKAACVQVNASDNMAENIGLASSLARQAAFCGAELVLFPENVAMMTFGADAIRSHAFKESEHPAIQAFRDLAIELDVWLHGGSLAVKVGDKIANRSFVFAPDGSIKSTYDKIHMFDVDLVNGESYRESETYAAGAKKAIVKMPWGGMGLTICYDVRFPYLYRELANDGAKMLAVPSAFTVPTGRAHWEILLRARAIENGCYVFAPAQTGDHFGGRKTYGHSLIIDPWGQVIASAGDGPEIIIGDINVALVDEARAHIPSLSHTQNIR